jgi:asparagine synthase (glutamine-hydrolysing)
MCGIAGFLAPPGERADRGLVERMVATLRHRGPDGTGVYVDGRAGLGVARLRVIDLETGDQPIANEDGSVHVVLNGEIYDFAALRAGLIERGHRVTTRSDTEVLVHLWEESGENLLERIPGMFAFALWDRRRERLLLARDRMGEKPLYWARRGGWLVFASELRALLAHPEIGRELDLEGVARYLAYDCIPEPASIVRGVAKLPPAHFLLASGDRVAVRPYWEIPFQPEPAVAEATWCERIRDELDRAVRCRLVSDVPLGCFLSGGLDSTAVTATAARMAPGIRTFSVGYSEGRHDERSFARLAAARLGTRHEELVVSAADVGGVLERMGSLLDEPLSDMSFAPLYLLSVAARESVTVALTGDGGDELFGGYESMAAAWWHGRFALLPFALRRALASAAGRLPCTPAPLRTFFDSLRDDARGGAQLLNGGVAPRHQAALLSPAARAALAGFDPYADLAARLAGDAALDEGARLIRQFCAFYLAGVNLANSDRASMATGLELRAPLLDHAFVELTGRIPSPLKLRGLLRPKALFKRAVKDRVPPEILSRPKQGFRVPVDAWFRGPLSGFLRDVLSPARLARGGVFDTRTVERFVAEHLGGARDHAELLWALLGFELWRAQHLGDAAAA